MGIGPLRLAAARRSCWRALVPSWSCFGSPSQTRRCLSFTVDVTQLVHHLNHLHLPISSFESRCSTPPSHTRANGRRRIRLCPAPHRTACCQLRSGATVRLPRYNTVPILKASNASVTRNLSALLSRGVVVVVRGGGRMLKPLLFQAGTYARLSR